MVDPVFLVDGCVAGRWKVERGALQLEPFGRLAPWRGARSWRKASVWRHSPRERARPHDAGAEPRAARAPAPPEALPPAADPSPGAGRRNPGAVRAVDVHRPLVAPGRVPPRRPDPCPRAPARDPGDADAVDDPRRLGGRLLAARGGHPRRPARVVGARAKRYVADLDMEQAARSSARRSSTGRGAGTSSSSFSAPSTRNGPR